VSDQPEYEVNPEPLGRCPFDEDCQVVESPTQFVCERALKREEPGADPQAPKGCGFVLPRTVCKREITREEAQVYVRAGKTELLSDFTSRLGRPFAATLVLKKNGRHGFEFQPREARSSASAGRKKATRPKKTGRKGRKAATRKKTSRKASRKTASTRKKAAAKKTTTRKKSPRKRSAGRTRGDG
jgi:DNA topoisomerase-3